MNIIAIIPARGNSKGIPNKNIIDFCGKPLLYWTINQSKMSKFIGDNVFVSSDSTEILNIAQEYNAHTIQRPLELATDTSSSEEALLHALDDIEKKIEVDLVVFLQCTSPLRSPDDIDNAINHFIVNDYDSLFSATDVKDLCLWQNTEGKLESTNFNYRERQRRQDREKQYSENGSFYIFKPKILKDNKNRFGGKIGFYEMDYWKIYEIDTEEDLNICDYYMKSKILRI